MGFKKNSGNNQPFYYQVYKQALIQLKNDGNEEQIYDDRGKNVLKILANIINKNNLSFAVDVGCGSGQVSVSLAAKYKSVIAIDSSVDALKLTSEVAKNNNIKNIYPILCDVMHLPFKNEIFDIVFLSGVLEWVPLSCKQTVSPERSQIFALKEINRILNGQGFFWIGIENRYSYVYFMGAIDHHSGLRFVTFLPRMIANNYSKIFKNQAYKNYLYSYWELRNMLLKTGLDIDKSLAAFPRYSNPKITIDLSNPTACIKNGAALRPELSAVDSSIIKVICKLHLVKLLVPNFILICHKSNR